MNAVQKLSEITAVEEFPQAAMQTSTPFASPKYGFVSTMQVVDVMKQKGWLPVEVMTTRTKDLEKAGYGKHLVTFRKPVEKSLVKKEEVYPQISFSNSHTCRDSAEFNAGLYRLACLNGLLVCQSVFEAVKISHTLKGVAALFESLDRVIRGFDQVVKRVNQYREIELTEDERGVFAEAATAIRWPEDKTREGVDIKHLLTPIRKADATPTLWITFNMLQERLIKGGARFERDHFSRTAKKIENIHEYARVNRELWGLTERLAQWKEGTLN